MTREYLRYVARRVVFTVGVVLVSVSVTFGLSTLITLKRLRGRVAYAEYCLIRNCPGNVPPPAVMRSQFVEKHNLDVPIYVRYVSYLVDGITLDWGYSTAFQAPVAAVLDGRIQTTLAYLLPGLVLAVGLGIALGVLAAVLRDRVGDWIIRVVGYGLLGIPAFVVAIALQSGSGGPFGFARGLTRMQIATLTVAASLLGSQIRFTRAAALQELGSDYVRMLDAKGLGRRQVVRHVFRNASTTVASATIIELLMVIMITIYVVESVLGIGGLATANLRATQAGDVPLTMWSSLVLVLFGVTGNLLQDVVHGYVNPRVRTS